MKQTENENQAMLFSPIGVIRTPYTERAPFQPPEHEPAGDRFRLVLFDDYLEGLRDLERFSHVYVLSYFDRVSNRPTMYATPPWAGGRSVGLFAARSPVRPNPIGLSVVRVLRVEADVVLTSPLDLLDRTPLLDIKPYFRTLDSKTDANDGWAEELEGRKHLLEHIHGLARGQQP